MSDPQQIPRYDVLQSYDWNYNAAPEPVATDVPPVAGCWDFCGLPVDSPLGIPAGPLLNGKWVLYYAGLGFDVLTYKTVRSVKRGCYDLPNLQPVLAGSLTGHERELPAAQCMDGSWAVSFGMPSMDVDVWRADVEWTRDRLPSGKLLSVSVVASVGEDWTLEDMADDYAQCARWAVDSGADVVEANFSCPNVSTSDGQLYQQPDAAAVVTERVRAVVGSVPFVVKVGHVTQREHAHQLLAAVAPFVDGIAMTNSVAATVRSADGELLFGGQARGICGAATQRASIAQTRLFADIVQQRGDRVQLIGVGGASRGRHIRDYLDAGAHAVHLATAAMVDPLVGCAIRKQLATTR
ncbi:MAG: hypothetical protein ABGZ17_08525 [Planctomycetaceae bacterium]